MVRTRLIRLKAKPGSAVFCVVREVTPGLQGKAGQFLTPNAKSLACTRRKLCFKSQRRFFSFLFANSGLEILNPVPFSGDLAPSVLPGLCRHFFWVWQEVLLFLTRPHRDNPRN